MNRMKAILEFIDTHPRIILLMAWPVFTVLIVFLILIIWKGPWLILPMIQLKQLDLLGYIACGVMAILGLNQLAQSHTFFGKLGLKVGNVVDVSADMSDDDASKKERK